MTLLQRMRNDDGGWAMVMVLGTMTVLSLLVAVAISSASRALGTSRQGQDSYAALAAAQAGVQHYLDQLNRNSTYYQVAAPDPANPALRTDAGDGSVTVPVAAGSEQSFRYQVLSTLAQTRTTGRVVLRSVGRSRGVERSVQVSLTNESIFRYVYYTEFETEPPLLAGKSPEACSLLSHAQHGTAARVATACADVHFATNDVFDGPVHTEDRLSVSGLPRFRGPVETGWKDDRTPPADVGWVVAPAATSAAPVFEAGAPLHVDFPFPRYNRELRAQAAAGNGCVYAGPTRILYTADGKMVVTSPHSTSTTTSAACGTFGPATNWTAVVPVPNNGVVWVDKAPASSAATCTPADQRAKLRFPVAGDNGLDGGSMPLFHNCAAGTVYVEGWVRGQTTLGAEDNVFVTGDLRYAAGLGTTRGTAAAVQADVSGTDVLGLYANSGYVAVYHPVSCPLDNRAAGYLCKSETGTSVTAPAQPASTTAPAQITAYPMTSGVQIDAAIIATQAFILPNDSAVHRTSPTAKLGDLTLVGAVAQRYRGRVAGTAGGTVLIGLQKKYHYDQRLKAAPPPYLADTTATAWGVSQFAEGR